MAFSGHAITIEVQVLKNAKELCLMKKNNNNNVQLVVFYV